MYSLIVRPFEWKGHLTFPTYTQVIWPYEIRVEEHTWPITNSGVMEEEQQQLR